MKWMQKPSKKRVSLEKSKAVDKLIFKKTLSFFNLQIYLQRT